MPDDLQRIVDEVLGLDEADLSLVNMVARAIVVYITALAIIRLGEKRFLGKNTAFDVMLGIIFGSVVSRSINGSASFFPTLAAGLVLVLLHWLFAAIAFHFDPFANTIKGSTRLLVKDGKILWDAMEASHISRQDLEAAMRSAINTSNITHIKEARLERSGKISFIEQTSPARVIDIEVKEGVQTVRIQLD